MRKNLVFIALWVLAASAAFPDGMAYFKDPSRVEWSLLGENAQTALIHFYKGREALALSVAPERDIFSMAAVWFFPVPARPEDVEIDILKGDARFAGYDLLSDFRSGLDYAAMWTAAFSLLPFGVFVAPLMELGPPGEHYTLGLGGEALDTERPDVEVHSRISRFGLTTELVTARTSDALVEHLAGKGLDLPAESAALLDGYIGLDYSFVVSFKPPADPAGPGDAQAPAIVPKPSAFPIDLLKKGAPSAGARPTMGHGRIGPDGQYTVVEEPMTDAEYSEWVRQFSRSRRVRSWGGPLGSAPAGFSTGLSVSVTFPTDRIYFPMKPTAVYGRQRVPVVLFIAGHVTADLAPEIRVGAEVYYLEGGLEFGAPAGPFWLGRRSSEVREFTEIRIDAPAEKYREDLWLRPSKPFRLTVIQFLSATRWFWIVVLYGGFSALASLAAGALAFRKDRLPTLRLAAHGLWNYLTILGFAFATAGVMKSKRLPEHIEAEIRKTGLDVKVRDNRKLLYGVLFYIIFIALIFAIRGILGLSLLGPFS